MKLKDFDKLKFKFYSMLGLTVFFQYLCLIGAFFMKITDNENIYIISSVLCYISIMIFLILTILTIKAQQQYEKAKSKICSNCGKCDKESDIK